MGKNKENFESLSAELASAKDGFDLKSFAQKVLAALGKSETEIADALSAVKTAGEENGVIQLKLDENTSLLVAANNKIALLETEAGKVAGLVEQLSNANNIIAQLEEKAAGVDQQLESALTEVSSLSSQLYIREAGAGKPGLLVDVDGEYHRLHGNNFSLKGVEGKLTAAEIAKRPELLRQMKDAGSGALVPEVIN
jgi:hypothetical protein